MPVNQFRSTLLKKAIGGFKWNLAGSGARVVLQLIAMVTLARLIGPADFGIFGGCLIVYGFAILIADFGFGLALVQRGELTQVEKRVVWGGLICSHTLVASVVALSAPIIAKTMHAPELVDGIRWMSVPIGITALIVAPMAELRRRIDFRSIQFAQIIGYSVGFVVVAIPLAIAGKGHWSMIAALIVQQATIAGVCYRMAPQPLIPARGKLPKGLLSMGSKLVGNNIVNWITENLDNLLIARFKGVAALGIYSISYNLARSPTNQIVNTVQQIIFSASSRVDSDDDALARGYLALLKSISLFVFPTFAAGAVCADLIVNSLYGSRWTDAGPVLAALCVAMPFHAIMGIAGPVLGGQGRPGLELRVQAWVAVGLLVMLLTLRNRSLAEIAWGVCAVYIARALWMTAVTAGMLEVSARRVLFSIRPAIFLVLLIAAILTTAQYLFASLLMAPETELFIMMSLAGGTMVLALCFVPDWILGEELSFLYREFPFLARFRMVRRRSG